MPAVVLPPVVLSLAEAQSATVSKQRSLDAAPPVLYDPRDDKIALLETALQSLQSTLEKMQSTTSSANLQQQPPPPMMHSHFQQYASPAAQSHEFALLPAGSNRWMNQSTNHFPLSAYNEPDAMCGFLFRMQQHNNESHQFAQQRTIERLELENFMHSRQFERNNQSR